MDQLIWAMVAWINGQGVITPVVPEKPPQVALVDEDDMKLAVYRCVLLYDGPRNIDDRLYTYEMIESQVQNQKAMYCHDRISVKLTEENGYGDVTNLELQAQMVHELVHWLQDYNGDREKARCLAETEIDAYKIMNLWYEQNNMEEYMYDDFTIFAYSQCPRL